MGADNSHLPADYRWQTRVLYGWGRRVNAIFSPKAALWAATIWISTAVSSLIVPIVKRAKVASWR